MFLGALWLALLNKLPLIRQQLCARHSRRALYPVFLTFAAILSGIYYYITEESEPREVEGLLQVAQQ